MNRLLAFAVTLLLSVCSLAAAALTVEPLPGSAFQTARPYAFYPRTIGVMVRDDAAGPVAGAEVQFTFDASLPEDPFLMFLDERGGFALTNADGVATLPVAAGHFTGDVRLMAYCGDAQPAAIPLAIRGTRPAHVTAVSGDGQTVEPLQSFARPWRVRATDAGGKSVPYAVIMFDGRGEAGQPAATFGAMDMVAVMADAHGVAASPGLRASGSLGLGVGNVCGFDTECPLFRYTIVPPAATAASIRPIAGSTPQTTCANCFFPNPIGVIVRDHDGAPMGGVTVTFTIPFDDAVGAVDFPGNQFTVETDAAGVATPRLIAFGKDKATVTATTPIALGAAVFDLKVKDKGPTNFEAVSGDAQFAYAWTDYAQPWVVRPLDRHGRPVPNAAVMFAIPDAADFPGGTFGGINFAVVAADAAGIATSPTITANGVAGTNRGAASGYGVDAPFVQFRFQNLAYMVPRTLSAVHPPQRSSEIGAPTFSPFTVRVVDASTGAWAVNVPVTFRTDPACGSWMVGDTEVVVMTDTEGSTDSPFFVGTSATTACATSARADGAAPLDLSVHVFRPENVVMSVAPASVQTSVGQTFMVVLRMFESGLPIAGSPVNLNFLADASGASATFDDFLIDPADPEAWRWVFLGNQVPGNYTIELSRGPVRISVAVVQSP